MPLSVLFLLPYIFIHARPLPNLAVELKTSFPVVQFFVKEWDCWTTSGETLVENEVLIGVGNLMNEIVDSNLHIVGLKELSGMEDDIHFSFVDARGNLCALYLIVERYMRWRRILDHRKIASIDVLLGYPIRG
jgi:hypothetical protein